MAPSMPPMHQPGFPPPSSSGVPPTGGMTQPPMGRPSASQMPRLPGSFPGPQVSRSGSSYSEPAGAGMISLSAPVDSQAVPSNGTTGAGTMLYSGLPGGRRLYPGRVPSSPVETKPPVAMMGMPSNTVSPGSFKVLHAVVSCA